MVNKTATVPTTLRAAINPVPCLVWLAARWDLLHVKTCFLDLAIRLA
jgi:hypothetical protein